MASFWARIIDRTRANGAERAALRDLARRSAEQKEILKKGIDDHGIAPKEFKRQPDIQEERQLLAQDIREARDHFRKLEKGELKEKLTPDQLRLKMQQDVLEKAKHGPLPDHLAALRADQNVMMDPQMYQTYISGLEARLQGSGLIVKERKYTNNISFEKPNRLVDVLEKRMLRGEQITQQEMLDYKKAKIETLHQARAKEISAAKGEYKAPDSDQTKGGLGASPHASARSAAAQQFATAALQTGKDIPNLILAGDNPKFRYTGLGGSLRNGVASLLVAGPLIGGAVDGAVGQPSVGYYLALPGTGLWEGLETIAGMAPGLENKPENIGATMYTAGVRTTAGKDGADQFSRLHAADPNLWKVFQDAIKSISIGTDTTLADQADAAALQSATERLKRAQQVHEDSATFGTALGYTPPSPEPGNN
jgi:hypothetical protein